MKYLSLAIVLVVAAARPAHAQSVSGNLDVVDQQSVLGWTCNAGDPNTKLSIELWAWDPTVGVWTFIGTTTANKQRTDVGRAGVCGTGLESNYHGFEWPIYPDSILIKNKSYSIYAYYRPTNQFLNGSPRSVGFPESGLPTSGFWRTDLDDPNNRQPALLSCIWPFLGANQRGNTDSDPLWIANGAGATWPNGLPSGVTLGFTTPSTRCLTFDPQASTPSWPQSNSATNAPSWPSSNFWVIHANYEPAYSMMNSGPPGQSQPLNAGLYSLSTGGSSTSFTLGINNQNKPGNLDGIPFLSFGAQMGRGSAGPLVVFDPSTTETFLQFNATKNIDVVSSRNYHFMGAYIEAMWGGAKRMVVVTLQQQTTARVHWDWNAFPSFFYPGGEIDFISLDDLLSRCHINAGSKLDGVATGSPRSYSIPIGGVFQCASSILGWTVSRSASTPLFVTGVHLAIELPDGDRSSMLNVTYTTPRFVH